MVSVAITPNGCADAVTDIPAGLTTFGEQCSGSSPDNCFCLPLTERMPFEQFLARLAVQKIPKTAAAPIQPLRTAPPPPCDNASSFSEAATRCSTCDPAKDVNTDSAASPVSECGREESCPSGESGESRGGQSSIIRADRDTTKGCIYTCDRGGQGGHKEEEDNCINEGGQPEVLYLQHQNSSLTLEFPMLLPDVETHLPWASGTCCPAIEATSRYAAKCFDGNFSFLT